MSTRIFAAVVAALLTLTIFVWYVALHEDHRGSLRVTFLKSGATFIEAPSGRNVLVDGGPDGSILRELGAVMPFYRRSLDAVVATEQSPAKIGGLTDVILRYRVSTMIRSAARSGAPQLAAFTSAVSQAEARGMRLLVVRRGQLLDLGDGTHIETLFPDRDASQMSAGDGCLIFKLIYRSTSILFACGSPSIQTYLATLDGAKLKADILVATGREPELFEGFVSPHDAIVPCAMTATTSASEKFLIPMMSPCGRPLIFNSDGQNFSKE